mmetsp:Transcript_52905/g.158377  ORF Transcript_52905/g.158377 Transcript_52905/m.158377 type:complete len:87 (-) Transcript_52905:2320-2580(-)
MSRLAPQGLQHPPRHLSEVLQAARFVLEYTMLFLVLGATAGESTSRQEKGTGHCHQMQVFCFVTAIVCLSCLLTWRAISMEKLLHC